MDISDEKLVEDCLGGSASAFEELVRRHTASVYRFVLRLLGAREDAEDVVQDTFVKAWRKLSRFDSAELFRPWLFAIARNGAIDHLRKKKGIPFSAFESDNGDNLLVESLADGGPLPHEIFARAETKAHLDTAIASLPAIYIEVLALRYESDLTFDDIGKALGRSLDTVKSQHRRALLLLRERLGAPNTSSDTYI